MVELSGRCDGRGAHLEADQVHAFVLAQPGTRIWTASGLSVVPDGTRTCPLPLLLRAAHEALAGRVSGVTVIAGTHQMSEDHLARHCSGSD